MISLRGSGQLGWVHASSPVVKLTIEAERLTVSMWMLGAYQLSADDVVGLESTSGFLGFGRRLRIFHTRPDAPERIVFSCGKSPEDVIDKVRQAGFKNLGSQRPPAREWMPFRWSFVAAFVAAYNGFFLLDRHALGAGPEWGMFGSAALLWASGICVLGLLSERASTLMLKPGRSVGEVLPLLRLTAVLAGFLSVFGLLSFAWK